MENKFLKRIFSLAMVIMLVLSMLPTNVFAAEAKTTAVSGDACPCAACKGADAEWIAWDGVSTPEDGKHYRLTGDVTQTGSMTIADNTTVVIDLAGHTITGATGTRTFMVYGTLELWDSKDPETGAEGKITASGDRAGSSATLYGGNIYVDGEKGGVYIQHGGIVTGGRVIATKAGSSARHAYGANIYGGSGSTIVINGGSVTNGYVQTIHTYDNTKATKEYSGSAAYGGNIYCAGTLTINGGTISGGEAFATKDCANTYCARGDYRGGNIYFSGTSFNINGGTISDGTALRGGNIYATKTVNVYDGLITNGSADRGGNICISGASTRLNIYGGDITEGQATWGGANLFSTDQTASIVVFGGNITNTKGTDANSVNVGLMYSNLVVFGGYFEAAVAANEYSIAASGTSSGGYSRVQIYGGTFVQKNKWSVTSGSIIDIYNGVISGWQSSGPDTSYTADCATRVKATAANGTATYYYYQTLDANNACAECNLTYSTEACSHDLYNQGKGTPAKFATISAAHPAVRMETCEFCSPSTEVAWAPLTDEHTVAKHYYLPADLTLTKAMTFEAGETVCLDMNGHDITTANVTHGIKIISATVNITNTSEEASTITSGGGGIFNIEKTGTQRPSLYIKNISVTNGKVVGSTSNGGNINAGTADLTIEDCTITGGSAGNNGGNICCYAANMTIKGDTQITGGTAKNNGNDIYTGTTTETVMYGGEVGDFCQLNSVGSFHMYAGTVGSLLIYNYYSKGADNKIYDYKSSFYLYGGTVNKIAVGSKSAQKNEGNIFLYAGTVGNDPRTANNQDTTMVATCSCLIENDNGTFTIIHTAGNAPCADCSPNNIYEGFTFAEGFVGNHDMADATCTEPKTCKSCGLTEGKEKGHDWAENGTCKNGCGNTLCDGGHTDGEPEYENVVEATCTAAGSYTKVVRCTVCDTVTSSTPGTYEMLEHSYTGEDGKCVNGCNQTKCDNDGHKYVDVVTKPTCQAGGYTTHTCETCNHTYTDTETEQLPHDYDTETGICKNGCNVQATVKVTRPDNTVVFYTDGNAALVAENNSGATLYFLKTTTVKFTTNFKESSLRNVTLATAPGVTLKDNSGTSSGTYYFNGVTLAKDSKFEFNGYPKLSGACHFYGYVDLYMIAVDKNLTVHGDEGAYLRVERNIWVAETMTIIGNDPNTVVFEANYHSGDYNIYADGGVLNVQNAKITCDKFVWNQSDDNPPATVANLTNATIQAGTFDVGKNQSVNMKGNSSIIVSDTTSFFSDGYVTMEAGCTFTTATADKQNTGIIVAEGVEGCVYYADGAYTVDVHTYADEWAEGKKPCTNGCGAELSCEHNYVGNVTTPATCAAKGVKTYTCDKCGHSYTEDIAIDANNHVEIKSVGEKAATCQEAGHEAYEYCTGCDYTTIVVRPQLKHEYEEKVTLVATCAAKGEKTFTCKNGCNHSYTEEIAIDANNHADLQKVGAKPATCLEAGHNAYEYCTKCDYTTFEKEDQLQHQWSDWNNGVRVCTLNCGTTEECKHDYDEKVTTAATCAAKGVMTYTCQVCALSYTEDIAIDANNHVEIVKVDAKPATCLAAGHNAYEYCTGCDYTTFEEEKQLEHVWGAWDNGVRVCTLNCGTTDACEHKYEGTVTTAATCAAKGVKTYTCDKCGHSYTEEIAIDANNHVEIKSVGEKAATCLEAGHEAYEYCTGCDYTTIVVRPQLKHEYEEKVTLVATCAAKGEKTFTCKNGCGDSYTEEIAIDANNHVEIKSVGEKAATCLEAGHEAYEYCTGCDYTTIVVRPQLKHEYEEKVTLVATCAAKGEKTFTCKNGCGDSYTEEIAIDANNHVEIKSEGAKPATCLAAGHNAYEYCTGCDYTTFVEEKQKEHNYTYADNGDGTHTVTCDQGCNHNEVVDCADGNADNKCDACGAVLMVPIVTVNGENFADLASAVAYANTIEGVAEIVLLDDVTYAGGTLTGTVVLDLNGKTINATGSLVFYLNPANLTVKDTSAEKTGKIDGAATVGNAFYVAGGALTIENGVINVNNNVICTYGGSSNITINGGEFRNVLNTGNILYLIDANTTVTVNGGSFYAPVAVFGGVLQVAGGTFVTDVSAYCVDGYAAVKNSAGMYEIVKLTAENAAVKVGDKYYMTVAAALADAKAKGVSDLVITIIGANDATTSDSFYMYGQTDFASVTIKQDNGNKPYYLKEVYTGSRTEEEGKFLFDGTNIVITDQAIFECDTVLTNNAVVTRSSDSKNFVYGGTLTVEPGSKFKSQIDDVLIGSIVVDGGKTDGTYCDTPNYESVFVTVQEDQTLVLKNGAYALINAANENGTLTVAGEVIMTGAKLSVLNVIEIPAGGKLQLDLNSAVSTKAIQGAGTIVIDVTGFDGEQTTVLDVDMSKFTGTVTASSDDVEVEITEDGIILKEAKTFVAEVNGEKFETLQAAIDAAGYGDTVTLLVDMALESDLNNAAKGLFNIAADDKITLDLNGHTISVTDNSKGNFIVFYNYGELTMKNGTVELTATKDRAFASQSTVILNRGGNLTIESGKYIHHGGDSMAITVDNSANSFGDAYLYVNGGEIISENYIAVRMRLEDPNANGNPGNGLSFVEVTGGYIFGANRGIWGQKSSSANELQGKLTVTGGTIENARADRGAIQIDTDSYAAQNMLVSISGAANVKGALMGGNDEFAVSGGTFTVAVPEEFCAEGYQPKDNGDGTYGVTAHTCSFTATVTTAPTTATEGVKTFTCSCGDSYTEVMPVLPQAKVTDKGATTYAGSYFVYDIANNKITSANGGINLPKTLVFTALEEGEAAANNYYADFNTDFYVKLDGLSAETVKGTGCYLAGYYAAYEMWVMIPLDNVDIQKGIAYPLLAIAGQDFSYEMICNGVKEFTCGLYLSDEFLAANPDVQVTVDLGLREEPADLGDLANVEYFESEGFEYNKEDLDAKLVAEVNGVKYYTLKEAIAAADGATVTLLADVTVDETLFIEKAMTLDLNGKTITGTASRLFRITESVEVTFKNGTIKNTANAGRCIETRTGDVTLNLNDVTLEANNGAAQPLTIGGSGTGIKVNIVDSTIKTVAGYAITTFNPVEMNITGSEVSGYAALNIKQASNSVGSAGSVITVTDSKLTSNNLAPVHESNAFATVMIEDKNITLNITGNSVVEANATNNAQRIFALGNEYADNAAIKNVKINVADTAILTGAVLVAKEAVVINDNTVTVPAQYASALEEAGFVALDNGDNTVTAHIHAYEQAGYTDPTFDADGFWTYTCYCGDSYTVTDEGTKKTAVATVNGERFETFDAAWAAVTEDAVVVLLADVTLNSKLTVNKAVTINGNGHSIIANHTAFIVETSADCTFENITLNTNNKAKGVKIASGNVIFDTVTIPNSNKSDAITVNGTLTLKNYFKVGTTYSVIDASRGTVNAEPGTVFDMTTWRGTASPAKSDLTGAVNANGESFFCAYGSTTYYLNLNSIATTITNLTLLKDVTANGNLTVKGTLDLNGHDMTMAAGKVIKVANTLTITGEGNVNGEISLTSATAVLTAPAGLTVTTTVNGYIVVYADGTYKLAKPVAMVGTTGYATLAEAVAAAEDNDTVTLLSDVTINELIKIEKAITLDLGGNKVTATSKKAFEVYANATIMNGTIEAAQRCVDTRKAVELTLTDVNLIADKYTADGNPQPLTIGGSENGTKVNMTNVDISAAAGYGIITFVKTELNATGCTISGYNALYVKPGSEESVFNFNDCDLTGSTASNDVEGNSFSTIAVRADDVTVNVDADSTVSATGNYCWAISLESKYTDENGITGANITVAGAINGKILTSADVNANTITVKAEYADELQNAGYGAVIANGMATAVAPVAKIGTTGYATLAEAVAAAEDNDTVTLLSDVTINELIKIEKAITLDLNGKKVTATSKKAFEVYANATIMNGTIEAAQRCVDTRKAVELTLTDVNLIADKYTADGNPQPLTIGGSENGTKVNMTNVDISAAAGYGIITFVKTELNATGCTISGYNALYVKPGSENSVFNFTDCDLTGSTASNDVEGNSFSTIAVRADDVTVNVDADSTVSATGNYCWAISLESKYTNENGITGANITVAGAINGKVLTSADVNANTITVKAEYADNLVACGYVALDNGDGTVTAHIHEYTSAYTDPTFDADGFWTYTCYCGDSYTVTDEGTKKTAVATVNGERFETFDAAWAAITEDAVVVLLADVTVDETLFIEKAMTLDLNGKTITGTASRLFRITESVEVTFENGTIKNTANAGRCIETRTGDITLNLNDVTLEANNGAAQPLTIGGSGTGIEVNIVDSTIKTVDGYAITTFNPVVMNITDSEVSGYAALNIKAASNSVGSAGSVITVTDSKLTSENLAATAESNAFATVMIEDKNITLNINGNSVVEANATKNEQYIFTLGNETVDGAAIENVKINVADTATLTGAILAAANGVAINNNTVTVPAQYASALEEAGFVALDNGNDTVTAHIHEYTSVYTAPTNTENGYTTYTCVCGDEYVVEDEGTMLHVAINVRTGESYATVQEAVDAAEKNDTVKLLKDVTEARIFITPYITLDLDGKTLTVTKMIAAPFTTAHIIDSTNGTALMVLDGAEHAFNGCNKQLPVWVDGGVRFVNVSFRQRLTVVSEDKMEYAFYPNMETGDTILDDILANGTDGTGVSIRIKVTYTTENGMTAIQYFVLSSDMVAEYVPVWDGMAIRLTVTGVAGRSDITFTPEIVSVDPSNPDATAVVVDKLDN